jgi:seryl-tRNA synthetase
MLDIKFIRENIELVRNGVVAKKGSPKLVDDFLALDEEWRSLTNQSEEIRAEQKKLIGKESIEEAKKLKEQFRGLEEKLGELALKRDGLLLEFPNLPFADVPVGKDEKENRLVREVGEKIKFDFEPRDYLTIAEKLDLIDVSRAGKVTGSRFGYLKNEAVLLEFALVDLAMKTLIQKGFSPIIPPVMVRKEMMIGMGKQKFLGGEDAFHLADDNLYLVGSSEHTIGPYHSGEILNENEVPKRYVGFSTCFRREAGSYGRDTKGILRVHQFDKVEMFSFVKPEDSEEEHRFLLSIQEELLNKLKLPYRVLELCTGDMDFNGARQFDIEIWMPGQPSEDESGVGIYRETNSTTNTTDYQARGIDCKIKRENGKMDYVHMLNGTAFAMGRMIIAIIENYQTKEGKILVPEILQNYVGKKEIG